MDKSHVACILAGAACASAYFWFKPKPDAKVNNNAAQKQDFDSADYLNLKNEQLARVIKYFGESNFAKM
jgi:hypothetical protein